MKLIDLEKLTDLEKKHGITLNLAPDTLRPVKDKIISILKLKFLPYSLSSEVYLRHYTVICFAEECGLISTEQLTILLTILDNTLKGA